MREDAEAEKTSAVSESHTAGEQLNESRLLLVSFDCCAPAKKREALHWGGRLLGAHTVVWGREGGGNLPALKALLFFNRPRSSRVGSASRKG